jgi:hypothetical protein
MNKILAVCTDVIIFQENRILDKEFSANYPGALWVSCFSDIAEKQGIKTVTGDVARLLVKKGAIASSNIFVIQEEYSSDGIELIKMGAIPFLITSFESPLYAHYFYKNIKVITSEYMNRILFSGAIENVDSNGNNYSLHFPSFSSTELRREIIPWDQRKFIVMIASNKYWKLRRNSIRKYLAWLRDLALNRENFNSALHLNNQLHDQRLSVIEYFGKNSEIDIYGAHWQDTTNLPPEWQKRLAGILEKVNQGKCTDKQEVSSEYKFSICFENLSYQGYVTEKIIDCFNAGVIPIYMGAPNINDFVPKNSFIDFRDFSSLSELDIYLNGLTNKQAMSMLNSGQSFLKSEYGHMFSYEGFSEEVNKMLTEVV